MRSHCRTYITLGVLLVVPLLTGCSGARLFTWPWQKDRIPTADARNPAERIICMWEASDGRGPDGLPARGFAGQVLFFTRTSSGPVMVEGDVKIYVFDDQGPNGNPTLPISEFDFVRTAEGDAWNRHLTLGTLGPSYNVFIPYMRRGRQQARCAVQIRFTPADGPSLFSDVATIILPGPVESTGSPASPRNTVPQPTQTVSHYVDAPLGRQPVDGPSTSATASLGAVVKNSRGVAMMPATSSESDRLTRIEQMLEQLAAQQREMPPEGPAAVPVAANGTASLDTGHSMDGVTPAGFESQPVSRPEAMTHVEKVPQALASRETPRDWNHGVVPPHETTRGQPAQIDHASAGASTRRLPPRPSWFDQERAPQGAPPRHHPLASDSF